MQARPALSISRYGMRARCSFKRERVGPLSPHAGRGKVRGRSEERRDYTTLSRALGYAPRSRAEEEASSSCGASRSDRPLTSPLTGRWGEGASAFAPNATKLMHAADLSSVLVEPAAPYRCSKHSYRGKMMSQHVAVLMGGWSAEREVSLRSGAACAKALENEGFRVTPIDVGRDIAEVLGRLKPDVVFNALHGRFGEDGHSGHPLRESCISPIPIRACSLRPWRCARTWRRPSWRRRA